MPRESGVRGADPYSPGEGIGDDGAESVGLG